MNLGQNLTGFLRNLHKTEMRFLYVILCTIPIFLLINLIALGGDVWFWISSAFILAFGVVLMRHEYKDSLRGYGEKVSYGRLESIVTNLEDAVIAYDQDFRVLIFNASAERIFNIPKAQVLGQVLSPGKASEKGYQILIQTIFPSLAPTVVSRSDANQYPQVVDISFDNPTREFRVSTDRIIDKDNRLLGFVKVVQDHTRETELIRSKSDFVSVAAHQLRTPLTAISWTLEGFSNNQVISEEDRGLAKNGLQATANLLKTVNDLLDTAEIEGGRFGYKYEEVDLIKFIDEVLTNAQLVAKEYGLQVFFDKGGFNALTLTVDKNKLGLAISNLVDNAMKYNSKGGSVTVRIKQLPQQPYIQVSIQDAGIGILPADMDKLFTKFYRAPNARKVRADGTGLGLYIARNIIRQHGGEISAESTLGRGTTFSFTLPTDPTLIPKAEGAVRI